MIINSNIINIIIIIHLITIITIDDDIIIAIMIITKRLRAQPSLLRQSDEE